MPSSTPMPSLRDDLRISVKRVRPLDWLMLALALLSFVLISFAMLVNPEHELLQGVFVIDYAICGLFGAQFLFRWYSTGFSRGWLYRNWYELLGMVPLEPTIAGGYWVGVLRVFILLARFGNALNRAFGAEFTYRLLLRIRGAILDRISGALTIAILDRVSDVLARGTYTENVSRALEDNQSELREMIAEKLREDQQTGRLKRLPFYNEILESIIETCMRVVEQVLRDTRTDRLVADVLRENLTQIRAAVEMEEEAAENERRRQAAQRDEMRRSQRRPSPKPRQPVP